MCMGELERKYDVKIETTEEKVKFPDELKANLKEQGMMDAKGKLKLKGVSPKMLKRMNNCGKLFQLNQREPLVDVQIFKVELWAKYYAKATH